MVDEGGALNVFKEDLDGPAGRPNGPLGDILVLLLGLLCGAKPGRLLEVLRSPGRLVLVPVGNKGAKFREIGVLPGGGCWGRLTGGLMAVDMGINDILGAILVEIC